MEPEYTEWQDMEGHTLYFTFNVEAVEQLNDIGRKYGVPPVSTFADGGAGVSDLLKRFGIPRKELAAQLGVSQGTVSNWINHGEIGSVKAFRILDAVAAILERRGVSNPNDLIAGYVGSRMVPDTSFNRAATMRRFVTDSLGFLTESQLDTLLELIRGMLLCNGDFDNAEMLKRCLSEVNELMGKSF